MPAATAVTSPTPVTVAIEGDVLIQVTAADGSGTFATLNTAAVIVVVAPGAASVASGAVIATRAGRVPGVAVAVKSAESDPALAAATDCVLRGSPSTQRADARPFTSVSDCTVESAPPPEAIRKVSDRFANGRPAASSARTTSGNGSVSPCSAVWALPETITIRGRPSTTTVIPSESAP